MPVKLRGNLKDLERRIRRGAERGLRDLTLEGQAAGPEREPGGHWPLQGRVDRQIHSLDS